MEGLVPSIVIAMTAIASHVSIRVKPRVPIINKSFGNAYAKTTPEGQLFFPRTTPKRPHHLPCSISQLPGD